MDWPVLESGGIHNPIVVKAFDEVYSPSDKYIAYRFAPGPNTIVIPDAGYNGTGLNLLFPKEYRRMLKVYDSLAAIRQQCNSLSPDARASSGSLKSIFDALVYHDQLDTMFDQPMSASGFTDRMGSSVSYLQQATFNETNPVFAADDNYALYCSEAIRLIGVKQAIEKDLEKRRSAYNSRGPFVERGYFPEFSPPPHSDDDLSIRDLIWAGLQAHYITVKGARGAIIALMECNARGWFCYDEANGKRCVGPCMTVDTGGHTMQPSEYLSSPYRQPAQLTVPYDHLSPADQQGIQDFCNRGVQVWEVNFNDPVPACGNHAWY
jgi:hypothetical protein